MIVAVVDGHFDLWKDFDVKKGPRIHAKLPAEIEKVTKVHMASTTCSSYDEEWANVAFFIETTHKDDN